MLIITAVICRVMFRFGNKPIEEGQRVFKLLWIKDLGTVKPKPWTRMQERGYHWRYAVGWMGNFIFFGVGLWYMSATLTPTPTLAPTLALALALTLSLPLIEVHAELAQEEQKRAQWRLENSRRRHNYVPFIIRYLKTLADRGELTTHVEAAKKKRKHPA